MSRNYVRKNSWELNRENAEQFLRLYESGKKPKEIASELDTDTATVWNRIQYAREIRKRDQREATR